MSCVKANGYGHGLILTAAALAESSDGLAVASIDEAIALRDAGISVPVLLLEGVHSREDWQIAANNALTVTVCDASQLDWLEQQSFERTVACWIKVDTGMHRLGFTPEQLAAALLRMQTLPQLANDVTVMTHFARADEPGAETTHRQLARLLECTRGLDVGRSSANSAAILTHPPSHLDWVRPGYMLYGGSPLAHQDAKACDLLPAMDFVSAVISLRDIAPGDSVGYGGRWVAERPSRIATIAAGYGDGYPRHAPNGTPVLVAGRRAPLVGRVSMDMLSVDVTDITDTTVGTPVLLWGDSLPVDEIARGAGTIGYELLAAMPERVPRKLAP